MAQWHSGTVARDSDSRLREPGFECCAAMSFLYFHKKERARAKDKREREREREREKERERDEVERE